MPEFQNRARWFLARCFLYEPNRLGRKRSAQRRCWAVLMVEEDVNGT